MAFVKSITEILHTSGDWQKVPFWLTYDERFLSADQMTTEHLINICRQVINVACNEAGIDAIPVKNVLAHIDFRQVAPKEYVMMCAAFYTEIHRRLNINAIGKGSHLQSGYEGIWQEIQKKLSLLCKMYLPEDTLRQKVSIQE